MIISKGNDKNASLLIFNATIVIKLLWALPGHEIVILLCHNCQLTVHCKMKQSNVHSWQWGQKNGIVVLLAWVIVKKEKQAAFSFLFLSGNTLGRTIVRSQFRLVPCVQVALLEGVAGDNLHFSNTNPIHWQLQSLLLLVCNTSKRQKMVN